jgi:hypothetical protein
MPMMITTPITCQNTEMLLRSATRCDEKMLIIAWSARMIANTQKISERTWWVSAKLTKPRSQPQRPNRLVKKNART